MVSVPKGLKQFVEDMRGMSMVFEDVVDMGKNIASAIKHGVIVSDRDPDVLPEPGFGAYDYNALPSQNEKMAVIKEHLAHYSQIKQEKPQQFTLYTPKLFDTLVTAYERKSVDSKADFGPLAEYDLFQSQINNYYGANGPAHVEMLAGVTAALVAGMQIENPDAELLQQMASFGVGAEKQHMSFMSEQKPGLAGFIEGKKMIVKTADRLPVPVQQIKNTL